MMEGCRTTNDGAGEEIVTRAGQEIVTRAGQEIVTRAGQEIVTRAGQEMVARRLERAAEGLGVGKEELSATVERVLVDLGRRTATVDELVNLLADTCASKTILHPDYALIGGRILMARLHELTPGSFGGATRALEGVVSDEHARAVAANEGRLDELIRYDRDFGYNYFAYKTLEKSYLLRSKAGVVVERPQDMLLRVAVSVHARRSELLKMERVSNTYELLSRGFYTHATPVMFNAGTRNPQLASCFLFTLPKEDDSVEAYYENLKRCGLTSSACGGIGVSVHEVANGNLTHLLKMYESMSKFATQGGNRRPGAFAIFLEPWHESVFEFLATRNNVSGETRDLFTALWVPDLFMKRVEEDGEWSLMNPVECPGLADCYGDEFVTLYEGYEKEGKYVEKVHARAVWNAALDSQMLTGTPYLMYKDACNRKSNQSHLGTIRGGNLCAEIVEYASADEVAVCTLASMALNAFVDEKTREFDFKLLRDVTRDVVVNLDAIVDLTRYPVPQAKTSNERHRPVGVGVQGLADAFAMLGLPFDSEEAAELNAEIFENIYYAAVETSCDLARDHGPHPSYEGSPASHGVLQFDMWGVKPRFLEWDGLRRAVDEHGLRNSLLVAVMPTASTAQILGNNESVEPFTHHIYQRTVSAGSFQVVNGHLVRDLIARGLWTEGVRNAIIADEGSIRNVAEIPNDLKRLHKTAYDMSQKTLINLSADRAGFIDQSQSLNLHLRNPDRASLTSMHFYAFKRGLKTGIYYLRSQHDNKALSSIRINAERDRNCVTCSA